MPKCKSCGAKILWIETAGFMRRALNAEEIHILPNLAGDTAIITEAGKLVRGYGIAHPDGSVPFGAETGRTLHTCPNAEKHKR